MKLRFNREEMAEAMAAICGVAATRTPKEILKCVRVEAQADVLLLTATDLELSLRCAISQVEVDEPGESVVVADTLARIVHECSDEVLSMETQGTHLHLRGAGSHFQIVTVDAAEFPPVPVLEGEPEYTVEHKVLRRLIEWTVMAAARESTRYAINGVLWAIEEGRLTLAATDGRRLSVARGDLVDAVKGDAIPNVILPVKALTVFNRLGGDGRVAIKTVGSQMLLSVGGSLLATSLVEGHFPKYQDVIPTDCDRIATLNTAEYQAALKQAALLTNEESKGVRLAFSDGNLTIRSRAPEQGEATVSIPVTYKHEAVEIGFNPVFQLDILRVVHTDEITLALKEASRPGVIRAGEDFLYVVMPLSLSSA